MNRNVLPAGATSGPHHLYQAPQHAQQHALHQPLRTLLSSAIFCVAAGAASMAQATTLDFESTYDVLIGHGDSISQGGVDMTGYSNDLSAYLGDAVGAVIDSSDVNVCANLACPVNGDGHYYAGINDGYLSLTTSSSAGLKIAGFDASFLGAYSDLAYPAVAGLLRVQGFRADGTSSYETYRLDGPGANGFEFAHYSTSTAFASQSFAEVAIFGFVCNQSGSTCSAFSTNRGQFAIDNILTSVPEPSTYLMLLLGLAGIAGARRLQARRNGSL